MKKRLKSIAFLTLTLALTLVFSITFVSSLTEYEPVKGGTLQFTVNVDLHGAVNGPTHISTVQTAYSSTDSGRAPTGSIKPENVVLNFSNSDSTKSGTIDFRNVEFNLPGRYTYKITESDSDMYIKAVDPTDLTYYVDIYVVNKPGTDDQLEIEGYKIYKSNRTDQTNKVAAIEFNKIWDSYGIQVKKEVQGNFGDKTKYFTIQIGLKRTTSGKRPVEIGWVSGTPKVGNVAVTQQDPFITDWDITANSKIINVSLSDGDCVSIEGLDDTTTFTITETQPTGYAAPTGTVNSYTSVADHNGELYTVINKKESTIPTGIFINNWPYILVIIAALAGCIVFVRRRKASYEYNEDL